MQYFTDIFMDAYVLFARSGCRLTARENYEKKKRTELSRSTVPYMAKFRNFFFSLVVFPCELDPLDARGDGAAGI